MTFEQCQHTSTVLRFRIHADQSKHFVHQCLLCGEKAGTVKREKLNARERSSAEPWDQNLQDAKRAESQARWREKISREWDAKREAHAEYLGSLEWRQRRQQRLTKDEHRCQAKMTGCSGWATEVHHLTYQHWGNEPQFDLVSVCRSCHKQLSERLGHLRNREGDVA